MEKIINKYNIVGLSATSYLPKLGIQQKYAGYSWVTDCSNTDPIIKMNTHTLMRIGSATKIYTAIIIIKLISTGLLSLDTSIAEISEFNYSSINPNVTIGQLLSMTSGLSNYPNKKIHDINMQDPFKLWTYKELLLMIEPYSNPGSYLYCNTNYLLLGLIAKIVSGDSLTNLYKKYIFQPLNLINTYYCDHTILMTTDYDNLETKKLAGCYDKISSCYDNLNGESVFAEISAAKGAGGIVSTSYEMTKVIRGIFNGTILNNNELNIITSIPNASKNIPIKYSFQSLGIKSATLSYSYGLTCIKCNIHNEEIELWGKEGHILGYESQMFYIPKYKIYSALIINGAAWKQNKTPLAKFEILFNLINNTKESMNFFVFLGIGLIIGYICRNIKND